MDDTARKWLHIALGASTAIVAVYCYYKIVLGPPPIDPNIPTLSSLLHQLKAETGTGNAGIKKNASMTSMRMEFANLLVKASKSSDIFSVLNQIMVVDAPTVRKVLTSGLEHYQKGEGFNRISFAPLGLVALTGAMHTKHRKFLQPGFGVSHVAGAGKSTMAIEPLKPASSI